MPGAQRAVAGGGVGAAGDRAGLGAPQRVAVSSASLKGLYNQGRVQGQIGGRPEHNPWWNATDEAGTRYAAAWEQGRQMGVQDVAQLAMALQEGNAER